MNKEHVLINRVDLKEGECQVIKVPDGRFEKEMFIVRYRGEYHVYENSCPHTGGPLDWMPGQFLDLEKNHIQCSTHHALFRINDGFCISGPCSGQRLKKVNLKESERQFELEI